MTAIRFICDPRKIVLQLPYGRSECRIVVCAVTLPMVIIVVPPGLYLLVHGTFVSEVIGLICYLSNVFVCFLRIFDTDSYLSN